MDFHTAAYCLRMMAATVMLGTVVLRASKIIESETLIVSMALGFAMLSTAAVFAEDLSAFVFLFAGHVLSVLTLQGVFCGGLRLHPVRVYRRIRGRS